MAQPPFTTPEENTAQQTYAPIDPALAESAIARIRKQVQGNGLRPSSVELRALTGQVYTFYGTTSVRLKPQIQEAKHAGRHVEGQIIQPHQINAAVDEFIARTGSDRGVLGLVHETILTRADRGFGVIGENIPLPQVSRVFVAHEACSKCHGTGGTACHNCHGQQRITCYRCHGQGGVPCVTCSGRGQIHTPQGPVMCHACAGRGLSTCPVCYGQRMINCPECQGQGKKICETCSGQGWNTKSWRVTLTAETAFRMRTKNLPKALVGLIERVGANKLSLDGHAYVTPIMGREAEELQAYADVDQTASLWFLYRTEIPFAQLDIAMGKAAIHPNLAGYKGRLTDVPDFMDALLRPGAQHLADAAQGGAGASQMILAASRYRALGDILRGLIRANQRRVFKALMDAYPLGLSDNFARTILKDASTALSRLSIWPRTVAMVMALVAAFAMLSGFYLYGGRNMVTAALTANGWPEALTWLSDILMIVLLGLAGTHAIRVIAQRSLRTVLEGLGVMAGGSLPLPKPGAPGLWLWAGVIIMAAVFAFFTGLFLAAS